MHFVNARLSCVLNGALDLNLPEAITRVSVFLFSCNALTHSLTHQRSPPTSLSSSSSSSSSTPPKQHSIAAVLFLILSSLVFTVSTWTACSYVFTLVSSFNAIVTFGRLFAAELLSSFNTVHCQTFYRLKHQCIPFAVALYNVTANVCAACVNTE